MARCSNCAIGRAGATGMCRTCQVAARGVQPGRPSTARPLRVTVALLVLLLAPAFWLRTVIAWSYWRAIGDALQGNPYGVDEARSADDLAPFDALWIIVAAVLVALAMHWWRNACYANALTRRDVGLGWMSRTRSAAGYRAVRRVQIAGYLVLLVAGIAIRSPSRYDRQTAENIRPLFLVQAVAGVITVLAAVALAVVLYRMTNELSAMIADSELAERHRAARAGDGIGAEPDDETAMAVEATPRAEYDRWAEYRGLPKWQAVLASLPLALISVGGAVGGAIGAVAAGANLSLARKQYPAVLKAVAMLSISALAIGADFAVVSLLHSPTAQQNATSQQPQTPQYPTYPRASQPQYTPPSPPTPSAAPATVTIVPGVQGVALTSANLVTANGVELSWPAYTNTTGDSGKDPAGYEVYRGTSPSLIPSAATRVTGIPTGTTEYDDYAAQTVTPDVHDSTLYYMVGVTTGEGLIPGPIRSVRLPTKVSIPAIAANTLSAGRPTSVLTSMHSTDGSHPFVDVGEDYYFGPDNQIAGEGANRAVFDFGALPEIPPGSQIAEAHLSLKEEGSPAGLDTPYQVHALTRSFNGTQVTWNRASSATAWSRPGGDYAPAAGGASVYQKADQTRRDFDATSIVRGWLTAPATEHGLLLQGLDEKATQLHALFDGVDPTDPTLTASLVIIFLPNTSDGVYDAPDTPQTMQPGKTATIPVTVTNTTAATWPAGTEAVTWHWTSPDGKQATAAGATQAALPHDLPAGATVTVDLPLTAPQLAAGSQDEQFTLAFDLYNKTTRTYLSARIGTFNQKVDVKAG